LGRFLKKEEKLFVESKRKISSSAGPKTKIGLLCYLNKKAMPDQL
jgi:hypothetical protein